MLPAVRGAAQDTARTAKPSPASRVTLPEVVVTEKNPTPNAPLSQTPLQVVDVERMERLGGTQVADALRQMAGATLKDYGGVGGVKTVSVRGMGSQFSTLAIDGIVVNDCQNGQVDLGRYSLAGTNFFSLSNGQNTTPLQSARAYASGSVMSMESHEPVFDSTPCHLRAGIEGGSFGYLSPSLGYEQRLGEKASISLWGNYIRSDGNYPFTLYYTNSHSDSVSRERRQNSAVRTGTADANFFYNFSPRKRLQIKTHYMQGYHQLPGPVIFYRVIPSGQHTEEQLFFTQARYRQTSPHWDFQVLGKYQYSHDLYEDTAGTAGHVLNHYTQREAYASEGVRFHTGNENFDFLSISLSADEAVSRLVSNLANHNDVTRVSLQAVLNAEYEVHLWEWLRGLKLNTHLLATAIGDHENGVGPPTAAVRRRWNHASPYFGATFTRSIFTFRAFFKDTYRVPNFNELYFFTIGRPLNPEKGRQFNVGVSLHTGTMKTKTKTTTGGSPATLKHRVEATADLYHNRVSDKIIAVPIQNMFLWSMRNLGEVEITGIDITANYEIFTSHPTGSRPRMSAPTRGLNSLSITLAYTYQYAVDRTDPNSKSYGHQIPYTPRNSASASLLAVTPWVSLGYTLSLVGARFSSEQNTDRTWLAPYADHGITLSHDFNLRNNSQPGHRVSLKVKAQVLNLLNTQYEVVRSYPMMGRNYRLALSLDY